MTAEVTNFLIGPVKDGIRKDVKPWAIPEDTWESLLNCYQFRGRIERRGGYRGKGQLTNGTPVMGLRTQSIFITNGPPSQQTIAFDTTSAYSFSGGVWNFLPSVMPVSWSGTDYQFFYSTNYAGAFWATNSKPGLNGISITTAVSNGGMTLVTITTSGPHGYSNNQYVTIINTAGTGSSLINGNVYIITVTGANTFTIIQTGNVSAIGGIALNSMVTTANQDGIRYYGTLANGIGWANYNPPVDPNNALAGALLIFGYRGYLVFLNTYEGNDQGLANYANRARWTTVGTPYYSYPAPITPSIFGTDPNTARDDIFGKGNASDAPTNEGIIGAEFVRDILIVYFQRSTWRLRFVNNSVNPFVWERVNKDLGADSTFSIIPFDKGIIGIGNRGIMMSDGNDTIRIDEKIPDDAWNLRQTNQGPFRVQGIRTFKERLIYWTWPNVGLGSFDNSIYPNSVLVYNYETKTWSYYDDSFTTFGYFYPGPGGDTWNDLMNTWSSYNNQSAADGVSVEGNEVIIAGNQQGCIFEVNFTNGPNDPSLTISGIATGNPTTITSTNHNLVNGNWIKLTGISGVVDGFGNSLNGFNFYVDNLAGNSNTFTISWFAPQQAVNAVGANYTFTTYPFIVPGSVKIIIGAMTFTDGMFDGTLTDISGSGSTGTIDYNSGLINITFNAPIVSTAVYIYVVSNSLEQGIVPVVTSGVYSPGGKITFISNFVVQSKILNFLKNDKRTRLSRIDFYTDTTKNGQFTCNIFGDSVENSSVPTDPSLAINQPLPDNPLSNIVQTIPNPYQIGNGSESMFRLYCDAIAQTIQIQLCMSNQQMAVSAVNSEDFVLLAMQVSMRTGGRLV